MGEMSDGLSNFNTFWHGGGVRLGRYHVDRRFWLSRNHQGVFNVGFGVKNI